MQPVANTPEILYYSATSQYPGDALVQWAIDMLEAGYDSEHLRILAGEMPPYSAWYLQPLTNKVFNELGLDLTDVACITRRYICWLIGKALSGNKTYTEVLRLLAEFAYEEYDVFDFYLLYYAMQDLKIDTAQWYWLGATRENINDIITAHFKQWHYKYSGNSNIPIPVITAEDMAAMLQQCTQSLFTMAAEGTTNTLSPNYLYIITEIKDEEGNYRIQRHRLTAQNDKKTPVPLDEAVPVLQQLYPLVYDFNFYIYKSTKTATVIDVRYYSKLSLNADYGEKVKYNKPMVHCKLALPFWIDDNTTKFDVNWEHNFLLQSWQRFLMKIKQRFRHATGYYRKRKH